MKRQLQKKWDAYRAEFYDQRGWTVCPCEEAGIMQPPTEESLQYPTGWVERTRKYHQENGGRCVVGTDRQTLLVVAWRRKENARNPFWQ